MFPKKRRIGKELFKDITTSGSFNHSPFFTVRVIHNSHIKDSKCAVVVSKKVAHTAVKRNLLRRRSFAILKDIAFPSGVVIALFFKKEGGQLSFKDLKKELIVLFADKVRYN